MESGFLVYLGTFLEGMLAFISPCMLPMLPIYVTYFAGGEDSSTARTLKNSLGFVTGFTLVYVALGATAGALGSILLRYKTVANIIFGAVVIVFGLYYMGVLRLNFLSKLTGPSVDQKRLQNLGFFSSMVFGIIFSVTSTACLTTFAGSALMLAASQGTALKGVILLFFFALGLGVPFIISALLLNQLKDVFDFLKRHYRVINIISGVLLVIIGISMMTGLLDKALLAIS